MAAGVIDKTQNIANVVLNGNPRIQLMKDNLFKEERQISLERALLYTESYKATEGEPVIIRRAKATAHIMDHVEISIREGELLVGNRTVRPRSGILSPEMDPYWIMKEIDTIATRPQDQFVFTEEDKKVYIEQLYPFWKEHSMKDFINSELTDDIKAALKDEAFKLNQTDKGQGHIIMDFPAILNHGIQYYIDHLAEKMEENPDNNFFKAGQIIFQAMKRHFIRYARLARQMSENEEAQRSSELLNMAEICEKLSTEKPATFYEALQLLWMTSIIGQYESNASSLSLGRMDQYLYPFYRYSLEYGESEELMYEVLGDFYIKTNDVVLLRSQSSAKCFAGFPTGYTVALGGLDKYGHTAVNPLSYVMLDIYHEILLPQPNLSVRMNEVIPRKFLLKTCETIRLGTGIPQLFNDEVCVPAFLSKGVSLEDARDYGTVGCVEISIPGRTYGLHDIALFNLLRIMELSMYELRDKEDLTYNELLKSIEQKIDYYVDLVVKGSNIVDLGHRHYAPTPFLSVLIKDCIENGKDVTEGGARYNFSGVQGIGEANLSDSMYVIKKMVFENKEMSFSELVKALEMNYEGKYAVLQKHVIQDFEKYGNDDDEVDEIALKVFTHYAKELEKYANVRGGKFIPGAYTVSAHIPLGEAVGATPDGRRAHEQLADGGLSPMVGRDHLGPTAVLKSVSKLDNYLTVNGSLLNVKFQPNTLKGIQGLNKFADFLMAYTKLKIQHIQFNVQSKETLLDAQKHPEKYTGLLVRVAGYSAFFVDLNKQIQDDIIARVEHTL
ncbi:formate C-acetyltransferase [Streptococcus merionis]|uniref:Formate acetyltransferase n=1 Tax=Streptococcus merionis TaxID=400065 RepID=A0A239SQG5_9STRE|nr:formate C-acetyltransferase [Streptococcus merionis]SNU87606.1 formate acetyltransferase [Streptococcus merionis]